MTTPANLTYTDLETRVMNSLRIPVTNTIQQARVQALINAVYRDVCNKYDWSFLEKRTVVNTAPKITPGTANLLGITGPSTVSVTINSMAATFSSVMPIAAGTLRGWVMLIPGASSDGLAVYRIAAHTPGSASVTLDGSFTDITNATASYILYLDTYELPADVGKLLQVKRYGERLPVNLIGKNAMAGFKIVDSSEGKPEVVSMIDYQTTGDPTTARMLVVHPYPDKMYRMEVLYKEQLNTELTGIFQPFIPDEWREVIWYGTMARAYPIFMNDAERGGSFEKLFNDLCALMVAQQKEYTRDNPAVVPANVYRAGVRRSRQRSAGGYTLGNLFDRFPDEP